MSKIVAAADQRPTNSGLSTSSVAAFGVELPAAVEAIVAPHRWLEAWRHDSPWVPTTRAIEALDSAIPRVLDIATRPAGDKELRQAIALLVGSWPNGRPDEPEIFAGAMRRELSQYPLLVILRAISAARRTLKFLPAISEMVVLCEHEMQAFARLVYVAKQMRWRRDELLAPLMRARLRAEARLDRARRDHDFVSPVTIDELCLAAAGAGVQVDTACWWWLPPHGEWPGAEEIAKLALRARTEAISPALYLRERDGPIDVA